MPEGDLCGSNRHVVPVKPVYSLFNCFGLRARTRPGLVICAQLSAYLRCRDRAGRVLGALIANQCATQGARLPGRRLRHAGLVGGLTCVCSVGCFFPSFLQAPPRLLESMMRPSPETLPLWLRQ